MWFPEPFDIQDSIRSCKKGYGIDMNVDYMNREYDLTRKLTQPRNTKNARLLLTNGVNDGWYALSYSDAIPVVVVKNFETGAHHSELRHFPIANTHEIELGHIEIAELIGQWLQEVREE